MVKDHRHLSGPLVPPCFMGLKISSAAVFNDEDEDEKDEEDEEEEKEARQYQ